MLQSDVNVGITGHRQWPVDMNQSIQSLFEDNNGENISDDNECSNNEKEISNGGARVDLFSIDIKHGIDC